MLFSILVITMALILLILVGVWAVSPAFRRWTEQPKFTMLKQEDRFNAGRGSSESAVQQPAAPARRPGSRNAHK